MNNLKLRIKKHFVNKKENTRKLKYEALLEENKKKNEEIINALYDRNKYMDKCTELENTIHKDNDLIVGLRNRISVLEEKNEKLLDENEKLRKKCEKK